MSYNEFPDITLKMLIEAGAILPNTKVYASKDHEIVGNINSDGSISLIINNQEKKYPFPSGAARAITKSSVNGWLFWRINISGAYIELANIKKDYQRNLI